MFHCVLFCSRSAVGLFCSVPACSLTELVSRLNAALMNVQDLPAAIRRRNFASSSNVQRILGIYAIISFAFRGVRAARFVSVRLRVLLRRAHFFAFCPGPWGNV